MADRQLSLHFWLSEFERASHRPLTDAEIDRAASWWAPIVLQPARRELGRLRVSSYVRAGDAIGGGSHADGSGLDVVPLDTTVDRLFDWYRARPWLYGQVIHERDHLHLTVPGWNGKWGEVLIEPTEGAYVLGAAIPWVPLGVVILGALLLLGIAALM